MIFQTETTEAYFAEQAKQLDAWLKQRETYLGASDISAVIGVNPYRSAVDVFLDKTGQSEKVDNEFLRAGRMLEPAIMNMYAEANHVICQPNGSKIYRLADKPFIGCTPDAWILDQAIGADGTTDGLLEIKNTSKWITDVNPCHYTQLQYQLGVTGAKWGTICYLIQGFKLESFDFERDELVIKNCFRAAEEFWNNHILTGIAPEPTMPGDTVKLYPNSIELSKVECAPDTMKHLNELRALKAQKKALEAQIEREAELVKAAMRDKENLVSVVDGKVVVHATYKTGKKARTFRLIGDD